MKQIASENLGATTNSIIEPNNQNNERRYHVVAMSVPLVYNKWGEYTCNGRIYALENHIADILNLSKDFPLCHDSHHHKHDHDNHNDDSLNENTELTKHETSVLDLSAIFNKLSKSDLLRPLVLRARKGERVKIVFKNLLKQPASIHLVSSGYDIESDGAYVGNNPNTIANPGDEIEYTWFAENEGVYPFHDMGDLNGDEIGTNARGLFGAFVVEPERATWHNIETGVRLDDQFEDGYCINDGLFVYVDPQGLNVAEGEERKPTPPLDEKPIHPMRCFREFAIFMHDEAPVESIHEHDDMGRDNSSNDDNLHHSQITKHNRHRGHETMFINYRAESFDGRDRELRRLRNEGVLDEYVDGEEQHHSSWLFGDCDTAVLCTYRNDPTYIRLIHGGVKETHVFHLHTHQWLAEPQNDKAATIDSITISPQTAFTIQLLYGAGSLQGAIGDIIWHCHLYPHFHGGMWGILRVHDVLENGSGDRKYPDGTQIKALAVLPDRIPPPHPTNTKPGFPLFMPGGIPQQDVPQKFKFPMKSPPSPIHPHRKRRGLPDETKLEKKNKVGKYPGEYFVKIGQDQHGNSVPPDRIFDIVVLSKNIVYNNGGWHDSFGHLFVLKDDEEAVRNGEKQAEPLFIRANKGEVVQLNLTNKLPLEFPPTAFDHHQISVECGLHVHLVKFDPLVSDGASVGWNYISGVRTGDTMSFRWYVDEEFGTIFFHDHLLANYRQKHGLFGAMIAEPEGAIHLYTETLDPVPLNRTSGSSAVIQYTTDTESLHEFREFCLSLQDFIPMFDGRNGPLNPPPIPGELGDNGVMGFSYKCEPLTLRNRDPAYWFSSKQGGRNRMSHSDSLHNIKDPATPIFHTYPGDSIKLRLIQGSHEEQHSFMTHGMRWTRPLTELNDVYRNQQTIGISEAFTFDIDTTYWPGDHLYLSSPSDDLWLGCWGIIRSHDRIIEELPALTTNQEPSFGWPANVPRFNPATARKFNVTAKRREIVYHDFKLELTDPYGLIYQLDDETPKNDKKNHDTSRPPLSDSVIKSQEEPLVLRCERGEWVEITLKNKFPQNMQPEPDPPELPLDERNRKVSNRVSMHANSLVYDVRDSDGTTVGLNKDQTIGPGDEIKYRWYADREGVVYLQDMADFRNHRHHGLIGALVVEPTGTMPTSPQSQLSQLTGARANMQFNNDTINEIVLFIQDGLRLFLFESPRFLLPDAEQNISEEVDYEDEGHKAFSYRVEPIRVLNPKNLALQINEPATPLIQVSPNAKIWLRLVVAADKPRNHSFNIHAHAFFLEKDIEETEPKPNDPETLIKTSSIGGLTTGSVHNLFFKANRVPGDYAYRTGVLKWHLEQGLWGILRVEE